MSGKAQVLTRDDIQSLLEMTYRNILPYTSVFIDAAWKDLMYATKLCLTECYDRISMIKEIQKMWTTESNPNPALPCLSVRSGFDLYLRVMQFPKGSEVIMSGINIPDMVEIVHHHGLRVVSLDVDIETTAPKLALFESLISNKTVAVVLAHLYGKKFDMDPFIEVAKAHGICVIEDCAEIFSGFQYLGHPESDISLFSFGVIKYSTCFGGSVVKLNDQEIYSKMLAIQNKDQKQPNQMYLRKILKYSFIYILLNCPQFIKPGMYLTRSVGLDHQKLVVKMLRGFPDELISRIRYRPSTPLLHMMCKRMREFSPLDFSLSFLKGEYVSQRLPCTVTLVGSKASVNNYWLFPILVTNPDSFVKRLISLGVDAYRGATQLNIVEPDNGNCDLHLQHLTSANNSYRYPHEAKYLIDHVVYLPVNKTVPFHELDHLIDVVHKAVDLEEKSAMKVKLKFQSKL